MLSISRLFSLTGKCFVYTPSDRVLIPDNTFCSRYPNFGIVARFDLQALEAGDIYGGVVTNIKSLTASTISDCQSQF